MNKIDIDKRMADIKAKYEAAMERVGTTPEPEGQKFTIGVINK